MAIHRPECVACDGRLTESIIKMTCIVYKIQEESAGRLHDQVKQIWLQNDELGPMEQESETNGLLIMDPKMQHFEEVIP